MKEKILERFATAALLIVMLMNVFILTRIWMIMNTDSILRENKATYILPDGFAPEKTKITWDESQSTPSGWAVRYARNGCDFCTSDLEWKRLAEQLERHNYRTIILLPTEAGKVDEDEMFSESAKQMAFIKMEWVKQFRFTGTPTTVIFDNDGRVLWRQFGKLSEADYKSAEKAILKHNKT